MAEWVLISLGIWLVLYVFFAIYLYSDYKRNKDFDKRTKG